MATIQKSLSTKKDGQGYSQVLFRVSIDKNKKLRLKTGVLIPEKRWDKTKGQLSYSRTVGAERKEMSEKDARLKNIEAKILKLCEVFPDDVLTKEWLENVLQLCEQIDVSTISVPVVNGLIKKAQESDLHNRRSFFDYMVDFRNNAKKKVNGKREGEKSEIWKRNFDVLVRALQRYEMFIRVSDKKRKDFMLDIDTLDNEMLTDIESYLRNEYTLLEEYPNVFRAIPASVDVKRRSPKPQPRGNNTICALFNKLRAFFNWLNEKKITANNPFIGYEGIVTEKYGTPFYISLEERNQIADFDLSGHPQLAVQRNIFVFQCCIGCRVSDLMKLTSNNIINGAVEYIPQKTRNERQKVVRVPLNARALALVEKYEGVDKKGRLFPFISSQKYNDDIKEIFTLCGITRLVTVTDSVTGEEVQRPINEVASSHMARRTFVGNLYKQVKDPNLIASMSGHVEGSRAFNRYREIDDEVKREVVSLIE